MGKGEYRGRGGHVRQAVEGEEVWDGQEGRQLAIVRSWVK
jgi:hypothetical protein